jgi:ferredoxin
MSQRGKTRKIVTDQFIILERPMVTRHYKMTWDLDRCIGCQIGPLVCPKDSILHQEGTLEDGKLKIKPSVDIDPDTCVLCGICVVACPTNAISITINDEVENPAVEYKAFPELIKTNEFDRDVFDWSLKDFVLENCPTNVISYDPEQDTMVVDHSNCIHCRQCEIATKGTFRVTQPWTGSIFLQREKCVPECQACADICPTRALHLDENGKLILADYYCIKCGACMQVCPIKPEYEQLELTIESHGISKVISHQRIKNAEDLPVYVERWRARHTQVSSGTWIEALRKLADDKASAVEIDRKRALKRRDLLKALKGSRTYFSHLEDEG